MKKILTTLFLSLLFSGFAYSESIKITISLRTGTYDGETRGLSKAHGYGTFKTVSGDVFVGKFLHNRFKSVLHCTNEGWQYYKEYNKLGTTVTYYKTLDDCDKNKINIGDYKKIEKKRTKEKAKKVLIPSLIFFLVMAFLLD